MDILNWIYLVKNKLRKTTVQNPDKDLVILGADVGFSKRGDGYLSYGMHVTDFAKYINESAAGNCPIQMHFKPGSIGEKVSFRKESGTDANTFKDVIIPGLLEITRGFGGGGIYNIAAESNFNSSVSPVNTYWNTQYVDAANTSWASLGNIQDRTYDNWRDAITTPSGSSAAPQYVGMPAVMKWDNGVDDPRYWLIMFTEWGVGNYDEYGFAYDRWEILPAVEFVQPSTDNTNTPQVIDILSDGVRITREYTGGALYNILNEPDSNAGVSPRNTKWNSIFTDTRANYSGYADLSNLESRVYTDFIYALDYAVGQNVLDTDLIMHDMTTDLYYKVNFDSWAQGCGGNGVPGIPTSWDIDNAGSGYPDGGYYGTTVTGGSGTNASASILVTGGIPTTIEFNSGENYEVGDILTLNYPGVTDPTVIVVTAICSMGGFSYTRTVIPQSCGVKFADGTVMNTAVTASTGAAGTEMNYVTGLLSPEVESDFIQLSDTIVTPAKDGVIASFGGSSASGSWIIGTYNDVVLSGGSGTGATANITISGSGSYSYGPANGGQNYQSGETVTCSAGGTSFSFTIGSISSTPAISNAVYKLGGIANFQDTGNASYAYLIGVISGDSNLKLISDSTTISAPVAIYENVSGKFAVNAFVRDSVGSLTPLTFATIVLDNTIAGPEDYFVSIVATAGAPWEGTAFIDIEFMSDQTLSYYN